MRNYFTTIRLKLSLTILTLALSMSIIPSCAASSKNLKHPDICSMPLRLCTAQDVVLHGKRFDPRGKFCYRYKTYKGILNWKKTIHHVRYFDFYKDFEKFTCRGKFWFPTKN